MFSSSTHVPSYLLPLDGVSYIDPISHMHRLSVLSARPPVTLFPSVSFTGSVGHSPVISLMIFVGGDDRSTPTSIEGHTSATPLVTSVHDDRCSTPSLVIFMDYASHTLLPLALGACLHVNLVSSICLCR